MNNLVKKTLRWLLPLSLMTTGVGVLNMRVWASEHLYMVVDLSVGPDASSYYVSYLDAEPVGGWSDEYKTKKLVLRYVEPGTFTMGSPVEEVGRSSDEMQHRVSLTKGYYLGVFEVTSKQYALVMGAVICVQCARLMKKFVEGGRGKCRSLARTGHMLLKWEPHHF